MANVAMLWKRRMLGVKSETAQNTHPSPLTTDDYMPAFDFTVQPVVEQLESTVVSPVLGTPANVPGLLNYNVDFKFWLKGSGTYGILPAPEDAAFQACGFIPVGSPAVYSPQSEPVSGMLGPQKSATVVGNYDGTQQQSSGVVGSMKMTFEQKKRVVCEFAGKGLYLVGTSDVAIPAGNYGTIQEPQCQNIGFTLNGYQFSADKFEIDFGNQIAMVSDVNSAGGIANYTITDRKPVGTLTCLAVNVATHDFFGKYERGEIMSGSCVVGTVAGNTFKFKFNSVQYTNVVWANNNGLIDLTVTLKFNESDPAVPWLKMGVDNVPIS